MLNKITEDVQALYDNEDYRKVAYKAANKFKNILDKDERYSCVLVGLWKASQRYDASQNVKFTTYLHNGVRMECITMAKKNAKGKKLRQANTLSLKPETQNDQAMYDLLDLIDEEDQTGIIYDKYINNMTIKEISQEQNISIETVRVRLKKTKENIQRKYLECV